MSEVTNLAAYRKPPPGLMAVPDADDRETAPPWVFGAGPADLGDHVNGAALDWARRSTTARALWRAWWYPAGPAGRLRRVYVVETEPAADVGATTAAVRAVLASAGETEPRVEAYQLGGTPSSRQLQARSHGTLLWSRRCDPGVRVAPVHDGPKFSDDHPRLADAEAEPVLSYLEAGQLLSRGIGRLGDVMASDRPVVVPAGYATDGVWIWSEATAYYLRVYRLAPDPALLEHIRALDYAVPEVDGAGLHRALAVLRAPW